MTAEVVIANSGAVALAADSAVTIGNQKIYNSALKVFALSKIAPVGIMVYGNAGLLGVPWEPIIKTYRASLAKRRFDSLEEYADNFLSSLPRRSDCFSSEAVSQWMRANLRGYFQLLKNEFQKLVQERFRKQGAITENETKDILESVITSHRDTLSKLNRLSGIGVATERAFRGDNVPVFREISKEVFQNTEMSRPTVTKLYYIATYIHTRDIFSNSTSGVVVAGFGEKELFPAVASFQVEGITGGKLKAKRIDSKSYRITAPGQCAIAPFAQEDMVYTFLQGMNPAVHQFVLNYLQQMCKRFPELVDDDALSGNAEQKKKTRSSLRISVNSLYRDFLSQLDTHTSQQHIRPIMEMVSVLPKDELAAMAESLVNLTAFKRKMTQEIESVGGPIDVAVISKGDGLVWVKRKHYFPKELNQHFFANYFTDLR
jgi:hypothetical protein